MLPFPTAEPPCEGRRVVGVGVGARVPHTLFQGDRERELIEAKIFNEIIITVGTRRKYETWHAFKVNADNFKNQVKQVPTHWKPDFALKTLPVGQIRYHLTSSE